MSDIGKILKESKTIAVVGCSTNEEKDSHKVAKYLQLHGYKIIPVNPSASEILGEKVYKSLDEIKEKVDIADVFRPSQECLDFTRQAIRLKPKAIWLQLGIENEEARELAEKNGTMFIQNKCIKIEHQRLFYK